MAASLADQFGTPLAVGDRIAKTQIADGAPAWATTGTVVALGKTRIRVCWDFYGTSEDTHTTRPENVRRLTARSSL